MAAQALKNALPTHLKPGNGNGDDETFARKHHGKTRSHMVSQILLRLLDSRPIWHFFVVWPSDPPLMFNCSQSSMPRRPGLRPCSAAQP